MLDQRNAGSTAGARTSDLQPVRQKPVTPWSRLPGFHISAFVVAFGIEVSRRPDVLLHPQFWAEDGIRWYADAYQYGWHSVFMTSVGYYVTLQRLVALAVQLAPLERAPLLFNIVALVVQVLPVTLLLSQRYAFLGGIPCRVVLSIVYLGLPNSTEINANLTNTQWHLALLACMVLLARPDGTRKWRIFDFTVISLLALTGPFAILLLPFAVVIYWQKRRTWDAVMAAVLAAGAVIQIWALSGGTRGAVSAGANIHQFIRITGHQVFLSALVGHTGLWLPDPQPRWYFVVLCMVVLFGTTVMTYAVVRGPLELKCFVMFSAVVFAASLKSPMGSWQVLHLPGAAVRYWFFPMMGFLASLFWMVFARTAPKSIRVGAALLALTMTTGIVRDWRYPPLRDLNFQWYAQHFSTLPSGTHYAIPINPGWTMVLVKK